MSNSNSAGCFMVVDGEFGLVARAGGQPVGWGMCFFVDWAYAFWTSGITAHKNVVRSAAMTYSYFLDHDTKILNPTCGRRGVCVWLAGGRLSWLVGCLLARAMGSVFLSIIAKHPV